MKKFFNELLCLIAVTMVSIAILISARGDYAEAAFLMCAILAYRDLSREL